MKLPPFLAAPSLALLMTMASADVTPLPEIESTTDLAQPKPTVSARSIVPPPENQPCWRSTSDINEHELSLIQSPDADLTAMRTYIYCSDSEESPRLGYLAQSNQYVGGEPPLIILAPNVHIKCAGDDVTESSCTLKGGSMAVYSPSSTLASSFGLPYGYKVDTSNLTITGMTFTEQETQEGVVPMAAVDLMAPGENMVFDKCRWDGLGTASSFPPLAAVRVSYNRQDDDGMGKHSTSILIRDSVVENNVLDSAILYTDSPGMSVGATRLSISIRDTHFEANQIVSAEGRAGMLDFSVDTETIIEDSCFVDNVAVGRDMSIVYLHDGDNARLTNNYGENNEAGGPSPEGTICPEITNNPGMKRRAILCEVFDATECSAGSKQNDEEGLTAKDPQQEDREEDETPLGDELMTPSPDTPCWTSTKDIVTAEMGLIANRMTELLAHRRRTYVICPETSVTIGKYQDGEFGDAESDWPVLVLAPNLQLLCGFDGSEQNHCVFRTPSRDLAIYSPSTDDEGSKIPASVLLEGDDYASYKVDGSGLQVVGITFDSEDDSNNGSGSSRDDLESTSSSSFFSISTTLSVLSLIISSLIL